MQEKKKHNIPPLRFAGFTEEWEEKIFFNSYIYASEGGTPSTSVREYYENGTIPFVKIEDTEHKYIYSTTTCITEEGIKNSSAWLIPQNSLLFTNGATIGNMAINKVPVTTKQGILGILPNQEDIDLEFLYYLISSEGFQEEVFKRLSKGTFATIILRNLNKIPISLPSLKEQEQIGAFFRALDELIGAKEEELEKLRQMKAALLEAMFPNDKNQTNVNGGDKCIDVKILPEGLCLREGSADTPRLRFRGFIEPWQRKKLGEVAEVVMCKRVLKHQTSEQGDVPFFKIGTFGATPDAYIPYALFYELKEKFHYPKKGDLLISAAGTVGRIVEFTGEEQYFQDSNIVWLEFNSPIDNQYLKAIYAIIKWQGLEGSTLKRLYNNNILRTEIPFPSLAEQERIGEFFRSQDEGIAAAGEQIERLKAMKQACLEHMFA